ncbi:hypothetical protein IEO21_04283 [Rhodonia placenta]|uniref:FAD-binding PCMH-type domain-containing protein n=1 Tax=Rhodonia placenta TaxID=104341 RepID=A0A8H7P492_9APHY|nr:hypothetical protein IEO21_04283 [Postia placenta]
MYFLAATTALALTALKPGAWVYAQNASTETTCQQIAASLSLASSVYYPGTAEDVGIILQILGENQTPFAVKDGGHIMNPGYSSTPGVTIAMTRFDTVNYDSDTETVEFGTGLVWDDVYKALDPYNVNVVGGRVSGIGVSGYTLGGGYSWLTNQYGLTLDTIQAFELVLPNGSIVNVTDSNNPDLFYGLKGGYNNFGIVTTFTLKTFPQGEVWAGQVTYSGAEVQAVTDATYNFANYIVDPKAAIITTYDYIGGALVSSVIMFYDAPTPPPGIFDDFIAVPSLASTVATQSFLSFILSSVEEVSLNCRYHFCLSNVYLYPHQSFVADFTTRLQWSELH